MKNKDINFIVFILFLFSSFIFMIATFFINNNKDFWMMDLLPLGFILIILINFKLFSKIKSNISVLLIILIYYFRMIILPFVFAYTNYSCLTVNLEYIKYIPNATLLMIYEFLMVMLFCNLFFRNESSKENNQKIEYNKKKRNIILQKKMFGVLSFLLIIVLIAFLKYPQFKSYFRFIFTSDITKVNMQNVNRSIMKNTIPSVIYWGILFIIDILQTLLPIAIIKKINQLKISDKFKFLFSLVFVAIICSICTPETARSFIIALTILIILFKLYPRQRKMLFSVILFILIPGAFYGLFLKVGISSAMNEISKTLQAYFSGVSNVATSFLMPNSLNIKVFSNDILNCIPFIRYFFNTKVGSTNLFNNVLFNTSDAHSQIIPMIGQARYYFEFVLAPIIPIIVVKLALEFEKKYKTSTDFYDKYLYLLMTIYCSVAPVLYNFTIFVSFLLQIYIPCKLVIYASKMKLKSNNSMFNENNNVSILNQNIKT